VWRDTPESFRRLAKRRVSVSTVVRIGREKQVFGRFSSKRLYLRETVVVAGNPRPSRTSLPYPPPSRHPFPLPPGHDIFTFRYRRNKRSEFVVSFASWSTRRPNNSSYLLFLQQQQQRRPCLSVFRSFERFSIQLLSP